MTAFRRALPWWAALPAAAAGGFLLDVASPGLAWWPAVFPAVALICASVWNQRARFGALAGLVAGAAFWMPHISWLTLYLGPVPWLGLCGMMLVWYVLFGAGAAFVTRALGAGGGRGRQGRTVAQALVVAGLWVLREQLQGWWPYDGFPWGRVAHVLADSPLAQSVSWVGFAGLSGLVVFACALPVAFAFISRGRGLRGAGRGRRDWSGLAASEASRMESASPTRPPQTGLVLGGSLALIVILALVPAFRLPETGTLRVAAVQGNSKSAIFDDRESGEVLDDHVDATLDLLDGLEARGERVDLIVWPENSAEFEVRSNRLAERRIENLARRAGAPIAVGTVLENPDGSYTNSSLVFDGDGLTELRYDKRYPVPFAEYMPNRDFFHALAPDLVDLVQLEYSKGRLPAATDIDTPAGVVRSGIAICFDIIFDEHAVAMVDGGAQVILGQTNNADFGRTDESAQQLAIARLRAVETGRALVNISTVGTSAIVAPGGRDLAAIEPHTAGSMVAEIPLVEGRTPALAVGAAVAGAWMALGGAGLLAAVGVRAARRERSGR
ncbi:apolipoprotein N-acyltransferase [Leucobacter ruminantium]|uniref:Apolipoprotein N-acyltransferase n=1 Tax=Leucobacter ruminantium TaxID=1289170 RepID=A0A939LXH0_9MICO|nr:apolipoprotein N-acyltransferase [Leucobacter ruminantium]MBO1806262.1 apolipoprotein N-acyltransferase [Leucobacter ruminantium]